MLSYIFIPIFCLKSYKMVFWLFPTKEPILVPIICPWVFSTCLHESLIKFCPKIILVLRLSQFESFQSLGAFWSFHIKQFLTERYFKIPHFGNLFVLVHLIVFNCFTLRFFKLHFFSNFILFFASKSKFLF